MNIDDILEIECPNCGERVYYEVTVCPKCGCNLYPDEEAETEPQVASAAPTPRTLSAKGIVLGALASAVAVFLLNRLASVIWPAGDGSALQVFLLAAGPISALAGGYLAGGLARREGVLNGLVVGIASLAPAYFLEAYWHDLSQEPIGAAALISWVVMVGCGALGGWLWQRMDSRAAVQALFHPRLSMSKGRLYEELLILVHRDQGAADRLIELEGRRNPQLSRAARIQNAIDRLRHDRR